MNSPKREQKSDAEVGTGILRGLGDSWKSLKFKKWIFHKYQESTRTSILGQMIGDSLKKIFDSLRFASGFAFFKILGLLRCSETYSGKSLSKTPRDTNLVGGFLK